jgi:2-polyprenyl-3-methyl-5-hydroxy-6-metoxy-1,4-benzoquinol methylase
MTSNIAGNFYDKYNTRNPFARLLMRHFLGDFDSLVAVTKANQAYEVGCGEGQLACRLLSRGLTVHGSDVEPACVERANSIASQLGHGNPFVVRSVYDLTAAETEAELVICCEVLEHLTDPNMALRTLAGLANPFLLVSVPHEPLWRVLNIARGAYLRRLGNTPGHIQHWTPRQFIRLLRRYVEILEIRYPVPWTLVLCHSLQ